MRIMTVIWIFKLFLVSLSICYCGGKFQYDLFDVTGLSPDPITVPGTSASAAPDNRPGLGIEFTNMTKQIKLDNNYFAYLANMIQNSKDLTFAVYFKIMSTKKKDLTYFPFFALSDSKLLHNYFSIGFESKQAYIMVEGKKEFTGETEWSVNIEQWVEKSKQSSKTTLKLGKKLILGKWMILIVRIKEDDVQVSLDCKPVVRGKLRDGRIGRFSYDGFLTFSQFLKKEGGEIRKEQFVGMLFEPQLINGSKAYDWFNPCTSDRKASVVVPEPRPSEYDDAKFKKFQDMSQQDSPKPIIYCTDKNGKKRRNNGDPWIEQKCYKYQCINGKITEKYMCRKCEDDDGTEYKSGQTWIDNKDKCLRKTCDVYGDIEETNIECKKLTCPKDEQYKPKDSCCPKCREDDCTQKKKYVLGCERKCSYGGSFECLKKTKGCWCPQDTAMNYEGTECIPTRECKCPVSGKMYLPGQSIRKSLCSTCLCSHGELVCFDVC